MLTQSLAGPAWKNVFAGPVAWPADATLFRQGEIPRAAYIVDSGAVKLTHVNQHGDECVIDIVRPPALVGASFILAEHPANVEAVTITRCSLRWCSAEAFLTAIAVSGDNAERALEVHRWHCAEIAELIKRAAAMSVKSSTARLDYFIKRYHLSTEGSRRLPFKQSLIASFLNITPEHLSRMINKKSKAGALVPSSRRDAIKPERHQRDR